MNWIIYVLLLLAGLYLFKINPVLCVAVVAVVLFVKLWSSRSRKRPKQANMELDAVLALLMTQLLAQNSAPSRHSPRKQSSAEDPLGGLFLGDAPQQSTKGVHARG